MQGFKERETFWVTGTVMAALSPRYTPEDTVGPQFPSLWLLHLDVRCSLLPSAEAWIKGAAWAWAWASKTVSCLNLFYCKFITSITALQKVTNKNVHGIQNIFRYKNLHLFNSSNERISDTSSLWDSVCHFILCCFRALLWPP